MRRKKSETLACRYRSTESVKEKQQNKKKEKKEKKRRRVLVMNFTH